MASKEHITPEFIVVVFESAEIRNLSFKKLPNGHIEYLGVLQTTDDININKKLYPKQVLEEALENPRLQSQISRNCLVGEGSHPWERKNFDRAIDVLPSKVTHRILKPYFNGNKLMSKIHTIEPCGKTVVSWVVDEGMQIGHSMRGLTPYTVTKTSPIQHEVVRSPMSILTYDIVFFPSHADALIETTHTTALESTPCVIDAIVEYINTESPSFKILYEELGIAISKKHPITISKKQKNAINCTFEDSRIANLALESDIMQEIAFYIP